MQKTFRDNMCHIELTPASFLSDGGLKLCVVQIPPVPADSIMNGAPRPHVVQLLSHLIRGNGAEPLLTDLAPGGGPALVVLPELSLGFADWEAVDSIVGQAGRDLMLVAGFGYELGSSIRQWANVEMLPGATARTLAWDDATQPISGVRRANGGWCWYRGGEGQVCVTFLKRHLDQREVQQQIQVSPTLLRIEFADAIIFPLICADVLQTKAQSVSSAQARISSDLALVGGGAKPILVPVSALQKEPANPNWHIALAAAVNTILPGARVLTCVANQAMGKPNPNDDVDRWRSLSGLYGRFTDCPKGQASLSSTRPLIIQDLSGAVVRDSDGCVVGGSVTWPPYSPTARFQWQADYWVSIATDTFGPITGIHRDACAFELYRLTRRFPPDAAWSSLVSQGYELLRRYLMARPAATAAALIRSLSMGVDERKLPSLDTLSPSLPPQAALNALATLKALPAFTWQTSEQWAGQLVLDNEIHVLIWKDAELSASQVTRKLEAWCLVPGAHPPLLVIAEGDQGSQLARGLIVVDRRTDVASPPPDTGNALLGDGGAGDEFTSPRGQRRSAVVELHVVTSLFTDGNLETEAHRTAACLETLRATAGLAA